VSPGRFLVGEALDFLQSRRFLDTLPDWETGRPPDGPIEHYLPRIRALLARLGNPERAYRSVIVGGTNGKGTTGSLIAALATAAGKMAGFYSSPHLHSVRERIRLDGVPADRDAWAAGVARIRDVAVGFEEEGVGGFSKFEALTALAAYLFREAGVDVGVFEVGLGGRYDATNAWDHDVSVLTAIDLDHVDFLGHSVEEITRDKAHIAREGCPLYTLTTQHESVRGVLEACRAEVGFDLRWVADDDVIPEASDRPRVFQQNACLARAASSTLFDVTEESTARALDLHEWPGRFEIAQTAPTIILDGAHNPAAAVALAESLRTKAPSWQFVVGGAAGHDVRGLIEALKPLAERFWLTRSDHPQALPPSDLITCVGDTPHSLLPPGVEPMRSILRDADRPTCVTGSLHLVAQARRALDLPAELDGITEDVLLESLACLSMAAEEEGFALEAASEDGNLLVVRGLKRPTYFLRNKHPFNDYVTAILAEDKAYQYELFTDAGLPLPLSLKVFNPLADERFNRYRTHTSVDDVVSEVEDRFDYPVVVKRNRGSMAQGVYLERNHETLRTRLSQLFESSGLLQNVTLIQAYVLGPEYRAVVGDGRLLLAYEKQGPIDEEITDDLNPLHHQGGRAVRVDDSNLLKALREIAESLYEVLPLGFCAIDLIAGEGGLVILEVNPNPVCYFYNSEYGREDFVRIYRDLLRRHLAPGECSG
jgi:dihydrofolate synthase/folylpolyglutamate synthase